MSRPHTPSLQDGPAPAPATACSLAGVLKSGACFGIAAETAAGSGQSQTAEE